MRKGTPTKSGGQLGSATVADNCTRIDVPSISIEVCANWAQRSGQVPLARISTGIGDPMPISTWT